jgi:hypothetical protein
MIFTLCAVSVCLAQERFHNDEFGFTLETPAGWTISFENEWSNEVKDSLERLYDGKTLLMLNPSGVKAPKAPCIQVQGKKLQKTTTSEAIGDLKETGEKQMPNSARYLAQSLLGGNASKYSQIDTFYNYNPTKKLAIAKILYQNKDDNTYFLSARAKFIGLQRVIDFRGYWKGENPEQFWQVFNKVINSCEFDQDAAPKGLITSVPQEIKEISNMSKPATPARIMKWVGGILGILIVAGVVKALFFR